MPALPLLSGQDQVGSGAQEEVAANGQEEAPGSPGNDFLLSPLRRDFEHGQDEDAGDGGQGEEAEVPMPEIDPAANRFRGRGGAPRRRAFRGRGARGNRPQRQHRVVGGAGRDDDEENENEGHYFSTAERVNQLLDVYVRHQERFHQLRASIRNIWAAVSNSTLLHVS